MNSKKSRKNIILQALELKGGNVSEACRTAKICRRVFYEYMKKDDDFASRVNEIRESVIDFAESQLLKLIKNGNPSAIIFFLKTIGKKRGYIETTTYEATVKQEVIKVEFVGDDSK